jgi:hypothetical protein
MMTLIFSLLPLEIPLSRPPDSRATDREPPTSTQSAFLPFPSCRPPSFSSLSPSLPPPSLKMARTRQKPTSAFTSSSSSSSGAIFQRGSSNFLTRLWTYVAIPYSPFLSSATLPLAPPFVSSTNTHRLHAKQARRRGIALPNPIPTVLIQRRADASFFPLCLLSDRSHLASSSSSSSSSIQWSKNGSTIVICTSSHSFTPYRSSSVPSEGMIY